MAVGVILGAAFGKMVSSLIDDLLLPIIVILGAAFGKMVSSLVDDLLLPIIGMIFGGAKFADLVITLGTKTNEKCDVVANLLKYGSFNQSVIDFLIMATFNQCA